MERITNTRAYDFDLPVNELNPNNMHYTKRLELFARWLPICQDIAYESGLDLPGLDRLQQMILAGHYSMCLLASVSLDFPDPVTQNRIVNQFLIDCFQGSDRNDFGID